VRSGSLRSDPLLRLVYRLAPPRLHRRVAQLLARGGYGRLLDVGGGAGHLLRALLETGWRGYIVVIDPDPGLLAMVPRVVYGDRVLAVGEALPIRGGGADAAVFHDSLHHIPGPEDALREAARAAGCVIVDDIDPSTLPGRLVAALERLAGYPARFMRPERLARILRGLGLSPRVLRGGAPGGYMVVACRQRPAT
jgi:SAM-dependent methyltransferase